MAAGDWRQRIVRPVAGRATDFRVVAQPVGERGQFPQIPVWTGGDSRTGRRAEAKVSPPASPTETPANSPNGVHRSLIRAKYLDQGAVEPRPPPRRPIPRIRVHLVLQTGTGDPEGIAHGREREDALQLETKRCLDRSTKKPRAGTARSAGRASAVRRLPSLPWAGREVTGCPPPVMRGSGPGQDSRSSRSQAGSVSVMAASRARPMPADPPRNEASSTKPCFPSTSAQAWKPPTPTPGLR